MAQLKFWHPDGGRFFVIPDEGISLLTLRQNTRLGMQSLRTTSWRGYLGLRWDCCPKECIWDAGPLSVRFMAGTRTQGLVFSVSQKQQDRQRIR